MTTTPPSGDYVPAPPGPPSPRLTFYTPTSNTYFVLGDRNSTAAQTNFIGINAITDGDLFFWSTKSTATATLQGNGRVVVQSTDDAASMLAQGEAMVGAVGDAWLAGGGNVRIVSGYGPSISEVNPSVNGNPVLPSDPTTPEMTTVVDDHQRAAKLTAGILTVVSSALGLWGNLQVYGSLPAYLLMSVGVIGGLKGIAEAASNRSLMHGFKSPPDPGGVMIHGHQYVSVSAGLLGSITHFAHSGSVTSIGGITAGLIGGVSASVSGLLSATINGLGVAGMASVKSSSIVSVMQASLEARTGVAIVRAPTVKIGDIEPPAPQLPTAIVNVEALTSISASAGFGESISVGAASGTLIQSLSKAKISVGGFSITVDPTQITIKSLSGPTVTVGAANVVIQMGPSSITLDATGVQVKSAGQTALSGTIVKVAGNAKTIIG